MNVPNAFPTIFELRSTHTQLLAQQRKGAAFDELLPEVSSFVVRARQTGAYLDAEEQRVAAQGLIDYWLTKLDRAAMPFDDATLVDFDESLAPELPDDRCPYVGLEAFREKDRTNFFGRAETLDKALAILERHRFLAVIGPSGSGKSSIVMGGLLPILKDRYPDWRFGATFAPGSEPLKNLDAALPANVLVIDQFEELFTLTDDAATRTAFAEKVASMHREGGYVIVTMREDYMPRLAALPDLQRLFKDGDLRATPLSASELREAIEKPAERVNLKFASGLVDQLVNDVVGEPAALPLLQFTLWRLWTKRRRNRITRQAYADVGGGRSAIERAAEEIYADLKMVENQDTMRRILLRMVRPGIDAETTRSRVRVRDLMRIGDDPARVQAVLDRLVASRLVRRTEGETPADAQVEVAHEALIRNWPKFVGWLDEKKAGLKELRRFESLAEEWEHFDRTSGFLDKDQLEDAEKWLGSDEAAEIGVKESLPALVAASRVRIDAIVRRERLAKGLVTLLTLFVILALTVAVFQQRRALKAERAEREKEKLERMLKEAEAAETVKDTVRRAEQEAVANYSAQLEAERQEAVAALELAAKKQVELQRQVDRLSQRTSPPARFTWRQVTEAYVKAVQDPVAAVPRPLARDQSVDALKLRGASTVIRPGVSLGAKHMGSACCVVRDGDGQQVLLAGGLTDAKPGDAVLQPARQVGPGGVAGHVVRVVAEGATRGLGLVRLDEKFRFDGTIPQIGSLGVMRDKISAGEQVHAIGSGSGLTLGTIIDLNSDYLTTSIEAEAGDQGAPVFDSDGSIIGIIVQVRAGKSVVRRIGPLLLEMKVELVSGGK
jgi:hypothetical protein